MARPLETYRKVFSEHILPSFPQAERRFRDHFKSSLELIRALPLATGAEIIHNHPLYPDKEARKMGLMVALLDADVAMVALGLKPMAICQGPYHAMMEKVMRDLRSSMLIFYSGLEIGRKGDVIEVSDPIALKEARRRDELEGPSTRVSGFYGTRVVKADYHHHQLGYPEPLLSGPGAREMEMELISGSRGYLDHPKQYYISHFGCKVYSMEPSLSTLKARAAAMALVEDVRRSPASVESFALIREGRSRGSSVLASALITRGEEGSGWRMSVEMEDQSRRARLPSK